MELVICVNGKATTTSMKVAEYFAKRHDNVIRDIDNLIDKMPPDAPAIFEECFKINELANGKKERYFELTRDGFTLLAMGFTGKQALTFKLSYIDAFNKAEQLLKGNVPALPADPILAQLAVLQTVREKQLALESGVKVLSIGIAETRNDVSKLKQNLRIENWQQCNLKKAVDSKIQEFKDLYPSINISETYRKVWRWFKGKFQIPRYNELPAMMYDEALKSVNRLAMHNLAGL